MGADFPPSRPPPGEPPKVYPDDLAAEWAVRRSVLRRPRFASRISARFFPSLGAMVTPEQVIATEWTVFVISLIFVGLRMAVRITERQANLIWSEVWLLMGTLWLLGLLVCDTLTYKLNGMSEFHEPSADLSKIRFASNYFFDAGLYFPKLSMLTIYFQLLPCQIRPLCWALYFTTAFTVISFFVTIFDNTFWCGSNPSVNWSTGPQSCEAFSSKTLMRVNWSLCFTTEALLFLLPFPLLESLRTSRRGELFGLIVLFGLGLVTLAVSAGRFAFMMNLGNDISIYIWATTEFSVSQIIVASMALRPLVKRLWRSVSSSAKIGGDTSRGQDESRRISTAEFYTTRTAVRIRDSDSPVSDDSDSACGPNGSEVELRAYEGASGADAKTVASDDVPGQRRSGSAQTTEMGGSRNSKVDGSWKNDSPV